MKHPQYDKLIAIANCEQMQDDPGANGIWSDCTASHALELILIGGSKIVRIKPAPTIMIGDVEVPEPLRVALENYTHLWVVDMSREAPVFSADWIGEDNTWLKRGLVQATEQGAQQMLAALIKQLGGEL